MTRRAFLRSSRLLATAAFLAVPVSVTAFDPPITVIKCRNENLWKVYTFARNGDKWGCLMMEEPKITPEFVAEWDRAVPGGCHKTRRR